MLHRIMRRVIVSYCTKRGGLCKARLWRCIAILGFGTVIVLLTDVGQFALPLQKIMMAHG